MDTLLGAFVGDLLKLLRMHSLEGILATSCPPCSLPRWRAICFVAAKAVDAGPPRTGDDRSRDDEGSAANVGNISTFSCKAEVGIVCG